MWVSLTGEPVKFRGWLEVIPRPIKPVSRGYTAIGALIGG